jgi:hypothetical protein
MLFFAITTYKGLVVYVLRLKLNKYAVYTIMALQLAQSVRKAIIAHRVTSSEKTCGYITTAFQTAHDDGGKADMLTVKEFIHFAKYPVVGGEVDKFYNNLQHDMPILITDALIDWMGFDGTNDIKRHNFTKCMKKCDPLSEYSKSFSYVQLCEWQNELLTKFNPVQLDGIESGDNSNTITHSNLPGLNKIEIEALYPTIVKDKNTTRRKFTLVNPDLFQSMVMGLKTSNGNKVRAHFITCKKVLEIYMQYQTVYKELQYRIDMDNMQRKMDNMLIDSNEKHAQLMDDLNLAREERVRDQAKADTNNARLMDDLNLAREERDEAKNDTVELTDSVESLNSRISAAAPDHIHAPRSKALTHKLILYGNNARGYRCIRTQHRSSATAIRTSIALGYDRHVMTIAHAQGVINLWGKVVGSFLGASFSVSKCTLNDGVTEADLVAAINDANIQQRTL